MGEVAVWSKRGGEGRRGPLGCEELAASRHSFLFQTFSCIADDCVTVCINIMTLLEMRVMIPVLIRLLRLNLSRPDIGFPP